MPALFHTGQTGIGAGLPGGRGIKLRYSAPMLIDDVAADFPELTIVMAHPSVPWQDEAISIATHKANVYIDLSGWSPKYFPPQLVRAANSFLQAQGAVRVGLPGDSPRTAGSPTSTRWRSRTTCKPADPQGQRRRPAAAHPSLLGSSPTVNLLALLRSQASSWARLLDSSRWASAWASSVAGLVLEDI